MPETVVHFQVRMPPDIHERLASWAKADKASLNQLVVDILQKAIEHKEGDTVAAGNGPAHTASLSPSESWDLTRNADWSS